MGPASMSVEASTGGVVATSSMLAASRLGPGSGPASWDDTEMGVKRSKSSEHPATATLPATRQSPRRNAKERNPRAFCQIYLFPARWAKPSLGGNCIICAEHSASLTVNLCSKEAWTWQAESKP